MHRPNEKEERRRGEIKRYVPGGTVSENHMHLDVVQTNI